MGLTKEVRDFFTSRINRVLDNKAKEIESAIDEAGVESTAIYFLCKKVGLPSNIIGTLNNLREENKEIEAKIESMSKQIASALENAGIGGVSYWRADEHLTEKAVEMFKDIILQTDYPQQYERLTKIQRIRDDVYGAVLLATTEPKLVATLTRLLENYGGDISELLDLIPNRE